jgi:hypothetical protein
VIGEDVNAKILEDASWNDDAVGVAKGEREFFLRVGNELVDIGGFKGMFGVFLNTNCEEFEESEVSHNFLLSLCVFRCVVHKRKVFASHGSMAEVYNLVDAFLTAMRTLKYVRATREVSLGGLLMLIFEAAGTS